VGRLATQTAIWVLTVLSATGRLGWVTLLTMTFLLGLSWAVNAPTLTAEEHTQVHAPCPAPSLVASDGEATQNGQHPVLRRART
jgi:hypothetical protein